MRRILLLLLVLLSFNFSGYAQEAEEVTDKQPERFYTGKNELKVNAFYLLLGFPELSYERVLDEESALGLSVAFSVDEVFGIDFMAIPYYRVYFGDKPASGFFVEGNAAIYGGDYYEYSYYEDYYYEETVTNEVGAGLGLAVGAKFMTESGWVFEVFGGAGRNFLSPDEIDPVYPRLGLTVGRRF
ncbi:DUF3575 domain-containing protein [Salinimicrobium terrae]|uniref:DUF3575 domain-containing protein n=1 Tax=Salinimicrobium terrae TaxID=470866 RepID=UPI000408530C|nr:DUF3575 domain-containing protein [Salinimicrobium terrae]